MLKSIAGPLVSLGDLIQATTAVALTVPPTVTHVLGLSRGPGTHHELGAGTLFSLGTHREQGRGGNGSDDTVGSVG